MTAREPFSAGTPGAPASPGSAVGEAREDLANVRGEVEKAAGAVKAEAAMQFERAKDSTASFAGEQKDAAARQLSGIATALRKTSDELDADQPTIAAYTKSIAQRIDRVSSNVKNHDVDGLVGIAEDYGRRQPVAMLGIAALAGFISGRFLLASGRRRESGPSASATAPARQDSRPSPVRRVAD